MDNPFIRLWKYAKTTFGSLADPGLDHSCAIRILNALTFIIIIVFLGLWITVFLLIQDRLITGALSENSLTNLTCLTFFGGLVIAIFVGALAGNSLRRVFWKMLIRRRKF